MNNRSSYLPNKNQKSNNLLSGKQQRTTINTASNKTLNPQQMIPKILQIMGKLDNPTNTQTISKQTLRMATTNIFLDIMCILFRAIDEKFQRGDCTLDFVTRAIDLFGYKGQFNKTYYSPVGAPHTWPQLIAIVLFFAELASYSYNFQSAFQQRRYDQQQNSLILSSFQAKNPELVTKYIQNQVQRIENQINNTSYTIDSKKMAIRNLHIAQKDISTIEKQLKKEEQLCYRTKQELMEGQGEIKKCEQAIVLKDQQLSQTMEKQNFSKIALEKLRYEIVHQELLPEECEKLKIEIRDIKNRITSIDDQIYDSCEVQKKKNSQYLQLFNEQATKLRRMSQKLHQSILNRESQIKLQLPSLSYQQFSDILSKSFHQKSLTIQTQSSLQSSIKERQFSQYFRKLQQFISRYENKFIKQQQDLLNYQKNIESIEQTEKTFKENIDKIDKNKKSKKSKNSMQSQSRIQIERNVNQMVNEIAEIQQEYSQKIIEKQYLYNQSKVSFTDLMNAKQQAELVREQRQQILEKMRKKVAEHKKNWLNIISNYKQSIDIIFKKGSEKFQR